MTPDEFREAARHHFGYLVRDYGFQEETPAPPKSWFDLLTKFVSAKTMVIVEGPCWDPDLGVYLSVPDPQKVKYGSYPLSDLLNLRNACFQLPEQKKDRWSKEILVDQMRAYSLALREHASDILMGDHTVFPILADRTAVRLKELDKQKDSS